MQTDIKYLQTYEMLSLLEQARQYGTREHCMFLLAYRHGLRESELSLLKLEDVRGGRIDIRRLKGSIPTKQPLYTDANILLDEQQALSAWLRDRGDAHGSCFLFTSRKGSNLKRRQIYDLFRTIALRAGIDAELAHPHILKHTLGAHLIRNGATVEYVQQALGHKDIKSTMAYTNITQRETSVVVAQAFTRMYGAGAP